MEEGANDALNLPQFGKSLIICLEKKLYYL